MAEIEKMTASSASSDLTLISRKEKKVNVDQEIDDTDPFVYSMDTTDEKYQDATVVKMEEGEKKLPTLGPGWQKEMGLDTTVYLPPEHCSACNAPMDPTWRKCGHCKTFRPLPGETIDLMETKFNLPFQPVVKSKVTQDPHEATPPNVFGSGDSVRTSNELQEWVLNHLPLKEDEKKALIAQLRTEELKSSSEQRVSEVGKQTLKEKKEKERRKKKKERRRESAKKQTVYKAD